MNLGLSQKTGEGEDSIQSLGQKEVHHKVREVGESLGKPIGHLDGWWVNPSAETNIKREISGAFGVSFKFSVATVNINNFWGCGGILLSEKEEVRAIFAAPSLFPGLFSAELEAILVALKIFVAAEAFGGRELVV
ncbi:hypothetical protein V6N13_055837 [Hibiscus sabdariffa]